MYTSLSLTKYTSLKVAQPGDKATSTLLPFLTEVLLDKQKSQHLDGPTDRVDCNCEAQELRSQVKYCTEQVEKLSREIKTGIEEAQKEADSARCALNEVTVLLSST